MEMPDNIELPRCNMEMPLAENPFGKPGTYVGANEGNRHRGFGTGTEAQRQLAIDLGWYKPREHTWYKCDPPHAEYGCQFCDGGLGLCTVCGGFEGQLTTECCGEKLSTEILDRVYACKIDFVGNKWITKIPEGWQKVPTVEWLTTWMCQNWIDVDSDDTMSWARQQAQVLHNALLEAKT